MVPDPSTSLSENQLIDLLRNGPPERTRAVLNRAYNSYWPMVRNLVVTNSGTEESAKDIYQDAWTVIFLKARNEPGFKLTVQLKTFLYAICRNKLLQRISKQSRFTRLVDTEENDGPLPALVRDLLAVPPAEEEEYQLPEIEAVIEQLSQLGGSCPCVLTNFYFHQLSMEQIADKCGLAGDGAARVKRHKCIDKLKEKFKR